MAKKQIEEAISEENVQQPVVDGQEEVTVSPAPAPLPTKETVVVTQKLARVRIHTVEEIDSIIAGVHYAFAKGKDVTVPSDVAAILVFAAKAYRI